jgi:hypothetical protein
MAVASVACLMTVAPAQPVPAVAVAGNPGAAAGGQVVPLPHPLHEDSGVAWVVNADGSVTDGNNEVFDSGGGLFIGPNPYAPPNQQASFDAEHNELSFAPQPAMGLSVSRRVSVDPKGGWCRFVEILENPTPRAIHTQVKLRFGMSQGVQQVERVGADKGAGQPRGAVVSDGQHFVAMVAAGRAGRVTPQFSAQPGVEAVEFSYEVDVPPRRTIALAHLHARRASTQEAAAFVRSGKEKDWLRGLPRQVVGWLANFSTRDRLVGGAEVLRGDLLDVVELRGGDLYKGTLKEQTYKLRTPYGPVELPADKVVAMVTLGEFRPTQLLVTTDGQIFGGSLDATGGTLKLELSSGQVTNVPLNSVRRFGYRTRAGEGEDGQAGGAGAGSGGGAGAGARPDAGGGPATAPASDKPMLMLRSGDRIAVELSPSPIGVATCYGLLQLDPHNVSSLSFQSEDRDHGVHEVRLTDGSRFAGVVTQEKFVVKLPGIGGGSTGAGGGAGGGAGTSRPATFASTGIARLQLAREPEEPGRDTATITLGNGDVLVGGLVGKIVLETAFDAIEVNAEELRSLRPGGSGAGSDPGGTGAGAQAAAPTEVQLTLWDGATLSGRLRADSLDCRLGCGAAMRVPVALVKEYLQPQPRPPAQAVQRIKAVVAELNADDWKGRDRAAAQLSALGPGVAVVLKSLRDGQPPEVRQRIDQILASFEAAGARPAPQQPPVAADGDEVQPNPPADVDVAPERG